MIVILWKRSVFRCISFFFLKEFSKCSTHLFRSETLDECQLCIFQLRKIRRRVGEGTKSDGTAVSHHRWQTEHNRAHFVHNTWFGSRNPRVAGMRHGFRDVWCQILTLLIYLLHLNASICTLFDGQSVVISRYAVLSWFPVWKSGGKQ